jgi:hypothetical protein
MEKVIQRMRNKNYQKKNSINMTIHDLVSLALANTKMPNLCEFYKNFDRMSKLFFIYHVLINMF